MTILELPTNDKPTEPRIRYQSQQGVIRVFILSAVTSNSQESLVDSDETTSSWFTSELTSVPTNLRNVVTSTPTVAAAPGNNPSQSTAKLLEELRKHTGLTWEQIARLFGVSRRSVHSWARGGRMTAANEEAVIRLAKLVDEHRASGLNTEEQRRALIEDLQEERLERARDPELDINRQARTWVES